MQRAIVVAVSENQVIGQNNDLVWHLPRDLRFFMRITTGYGLLLGRKTMEALGKPLKNRHHIVVSKSYTPKDENIAVVSSIPDGLALGRELQLQKLFIAGGGTIYKQYLEQQLVDVVYLTRVHTQVEGDTFFPELAAMPGEWQKMSQTHYKADEQNNHAMTFEMWVPASTKFRLAFQK